MNAAVAAPVRTDVRNIAIIAHVDHGKTTLVDGLLKQAHVFRDPDAAGTLIMDTNELERERGITILAKNTAIHYEGVKINIIDTPGHADFGGEVERVLNMADGCLLLVDAVEGPMPQTRFVLGKALALGLRPIVVINKIDRPSARPAAVLALTQDLFLDLATDVEQLDFPVLYTIAKQGVAGYRPDALADDLRPLFAAILDQIPGPRADADAPLRLLVTALDYDPHRGRIAIGRVGQGRLVAGRPVALVRADGATTTHRLTWLATYDGLGRVEVDEVAAGDIVAVAGIGDVTIGDTIADPADPGRYGAIVVEEPTLQLTFGVNTSPFAGRDGTLLTSRQLKARLERELETNVSLRVRPTDSAEVFEVAGRGELHLSILIETMRREGAEFQVSRPEVITKELAGARHEPYELLTIDTTEATVGAVTDLLGPRRAVMTNLVHDHAGRVRLEFEAPTRGLLGFRGIFLTATRGEGVLSSLLLGYRPWAGPIGTTRNGALIAHETGTAVTYGLVAAQQRGATFVEPGEEVYEGMIVGQNARESDLTVNVCKEKKQSNMRSSTAEIDVRLSPPTRLSLEQALDFLADDELLEVTPKHARLRKRLLHEHDRARARKAR
ncbi:MAG TPA: translational GTPase TypA [Thermomicrobiales bacterium]|nr:translational GTPase TypA [Thermomicrobiales bacterium]